MRGLSPAWRTNYVYPVLTSGLDRRCVPNLIDCIVFNALFNSILAMTRRPAHLSMLCGVISPIPNHWLHFQIFIVPTMTRGERGMNPVPTTIMTSELEVAGSIPGFANILSEDWWSSLRKDSFLSHRCPFLSDYSKYKLYLPTCKWGFNSSIPYR